MRVGEVRRLETGKKSICVALGVFAQREGKAIHIHLTGPPKFHVWVTNRTDSERYHRVLFRNLRRLLVQENRWPFGDEGAETEEKE
jgi:hypothetical protein